MDLFSNAVNINYNKPTILAVLETIIAITLSITIASITHSLLHVAIGACIAPLLLMRSHNSTNLGAQLFWRILPRIPKTDYPPFRIFTLFTILILSLCIRVYATLRHPLKGFLSIPDNWNRIVLCTDVKTPLELVPGTGPVKDVLKVVLRDQEKNLYRDIKILIYNNSILIVPIFIATFIHYSIIPITVETATILIVIWIFTNLIVNALKYSMYLLSLMYRFSIKSTSIIWLPLIYAVRIPIDKSLPISLKIAEIRDSELWKIIRFISWATLFLLFLKIVILPGASDWWNSQPWTEVLDVYVMPSVLHPWHVATGLNAMLALISYYLFFERAPRYLSEGIWTNTSTERTLQIFSFVRGFISVYTCLAGAILTVEAVTIVNWPDWSWQLLPLHKL